MEAFRPVWKPLLILYLLVFIRSIIQLSYSQFLPLFLHLERGYTPAASVAPGKAAAKAPSARPNLDWQEMLRTGQFYQLWLMFVLAASAGLMIISCMCARDGRQHTINTVTATSTGRKIRARFSGLTGTIWRRSRR